MIHDMMHSSWDLMRREAAVGLVNSTNLILTDVNVEISYSVLYAWHRVTFKQVSPLPFMLICLT
jgi:hypothetical protein